MNDKDRTSIHEAMEQQSISISKAGIVTSLQARCAVIAAANPLKGRYDPSLSFAQNVDLTEPILSRFDVMCIVRDEVDPIVDEQLANFVVGSHIRSHPAQPRTDVALEQPGTTIPQDLLKKYIVYAKQKCHPKSTNMDKDKVSKLYAELRKESALIGGGGVPMTVRHLESLIRLAEAHARMHLRDYVRDDDVNMAVRVVLESFINAQKFSVSQSLKKKFRKYITYKKDNNELLLYLLQNLVRENLAFHFHHLHHPADAESEATSIDAEDFEIRARELGIDDVLPFYKSELFKANHFTFNAKSKKIMKSF
eukprot:TRINITY_DN5973_c0_g1_i3.p1 TRINITY_DN5973_c0_g1~~TRINITY_DN5973_c0_g1_i3.p1  ORF type:complete len:321 (-),score=73.64 TRINITY_DN5973_c0_g1_i3:208-1134(-)